MGLKKNKSKKILAVFCIFFVVSIFVLPAIVNAQAEGATDTSLNWFGCLTSPFTCTVFGITLFVNGFLVMFVNLAGWLVNLALEFNEGVSDAPAVQSGFGVALSLANLGFVLGIIIVAIATILRSQTYGIKQILWKLVVAAILVNFALVIAGTILTFSDDISDYFLRAFRFGNFSNFTLQLTKGFAPQTLFRPPSASATDKLTKCMQNAALEDSAWKRSTGGLLCGKRALVDVSEAAFGFDDFVSSLNNLLFGIIMNVVIFITLCALAVMLLIRYVYIGILLILSPFAWLLWIFPNFKSHFTKWWNNFLRWAFFPPLVLFFLGLAITTTAGRDDYLQRAGQTVKTAEGLAAMVEPNFIATAAEQIIVIALAIGGLFAANSLSITGASVAMGALKSAGAWAQGYVGKKGGLIIGERVRTAGTRRDATGKASTALQRIGSKLQGVPFGGAAGRVIAKWGQAESPERAAEIAKYQKENLSTLTNEGVMAMAQRKTAFVDTTEAAAVASELAKRDLFASLPPSDQKKYLGMAERTGALQNVLSNRPELAAQTSMATPRDITDPVTGARRLETAAEAMTRAIQEATRKIKVADIEQLNHQSLGNHRDPAAPPTNEQMTIVMSLSNSQLGKLGQGDDVRQIEALRNTLRQTIDQYTAGTLTLSPQQQDQMNRVIEYLKDSPHWQAI